MNLEWLRYYHEVLKCGSINKASENLFISRSSLRANLSALEAEIGAPLLIYTKTGCRPTSLGEQIALESSVLFHYVDNWKRKARGSSDIINILSDRLFCEIVLTPLILKMSNRKPPINLAFNSVSMGSVMDALQNNRCHMGIVSAFKKDCSNLKLMIPENKWQIEKLFDDEFSILLNRQHPLAGEDAISLSELSDMAIIWLSDAQHYSEQYDNGFYDLFEGKPPSSTGRAVVDSHYNALNIIASNPGYYGVFTSMICHSPTYEVLTDRICAVPLSSTHALTNTYNLITMKPEFQSEEEKIVIRYIRSYLKQLFK